jgi:hypothetical protein
MKFLLQVRFNAANTGIGVLPAGEQQRVTDEFVAIRQSPDVLDGNQLQAASEAASVRVDDGWQVRATKARPSRREASWPGITSTMRRASMRRSRSRHGSRSPGSAGPSRSARCWRAGQGRPAGANRTLISGNVPHPCGLPASVIARIGLDKIGLPAEAISASTPPTKAITVLQQSQVTTFTRAHMTAAFDGMAGPDLRERSGSGSALACCLSPSRMAR